MFSYIMKHFYTCEIHSTKTSGMWANRKYNRITPLEINKSFVMMKGGFRSRSTWLLTKHDNLNPEYDLILKSKDSTNATSSRNATAASRGNQEAVDREYVLHNPNNHEYFDGYKVYDYTLGGSIHENNIYLDQVLGWKVLLHMNGRCSTSLIFSWLS